MKSSKTARIPATKAGAARVPILEVDEEHEHGAYPGPAQRIDVGQFKDRF